MTSLPWRCDRSAEPTSASIGGSYLANCAPVHGALALGKEVEPARPGADHTSIPGFIETRFGLPALTARDPNADPMLEFLDFARPRLLRPPSLPAATIDPAPFAECGSG